MRQAGTLPTEAAARRFADHMLAQGVQTQVDPDEGGWAIWVYEDDELARASEELESFRVRPEDPAYRRTAEIGASARAARERQQHRDRRRAVNVRARWLQREHGLAPASIVLIAASVLVGLLTQLGRSGGALQQALAIASYDVAGGYVRWRGLQQVADGQVWRLVTPIFLHFGVLHLLFNMWWLHALGGMVERRKSTWFLLLLVVPAAILSNVGQYLVSGPAFGGMSGVVYALFGYVWMKGRYDPASGLGLYPNTVWIMLGWFVLGLTGLVGHIANVAHGVGLVVGVAAGALPHLWRRR